MDKKPTRKTVYLISPDASKIEGLEACWENLKIITNQKTPYLLKAQKRGVEIIFVKNPQAKKTSELLESPAVGKILKRGNRILVFKNLPKIEKLGESKGWEILMGEARFVNEIEDKIHFVKFCEKYFPFCLFLYIQHFTDHILKELIWNIFLNNRIRIFYKS